MSVAGPMARSAEDLRLALRILAGPDGLDTHVPPVLWRDLERSRIRNLRIAWSSEFPQISTVDEIRTVMEGVVRELAGEGAIVQQSMPDVDLVHQYELGEELFDVLADTFSAEPSVFSQRYSQVLNLDLVAAVIKPSGGVSRGDLRERLLHRFEEGFVGARTELSEDVLYL
jgi:Asp-tRNA(Asn)/Glu-tRNA(Gln) amidotransferase A subunit family amidase